MPRPSTLSLLEPSQAWRSAPMPGATEPLDLVRLAAAENEFAILGRFPAGFQRSAPGGYRAAEEFLVLCGELELEGRVAARSSLCFVPAHHVRAPMRSPTGCTVLAWFSGPADFRVPAELSPACGSRMSTVDVRTALSSGELLRTEDVRWTLADGPPPGGWPDTVDVVDLALTRWVHVLPGESADLPDGPLLVRYHLAGAAR